MVDARNGSPGAAGRMWAGLSPVASQFYHRGSQRTCCGKQGEAGEEPGEGGLQYSAAPCSSGTRHAVLPVTLREGGHPDALWLGRSRKILAEQELCTVPSRSSLEEKSFSG